MNKVAEQDSLEALIAEFRSAKANGDPAKYVHVISVKQAHQTADTLSQMRALISEESIERLATDIAIACVDCRPEIREARHRAMVRLGERLRNPLPNDLRALTTTKGRADD